jgi:hypothetical protein
VCEAFVVFIAGEEILSREQKAIPYLKVSSEPKFLFEVEVIAFMMAETAVFMRFTSG